MQTLVRQFAYNKCSCVSGTREEESPTMARVVSSGRVGPGTASIKVALCWGYRLCWGWRDESVDEVVEAEVGMYHMVALLVCYARLLLVRSAIII
jgi:hypothetical protein